jgi:hypothetical protein
MISTMLVLLFGLIASRTTSKTVRAADRPAAKVGGFDEEASFHRYAGSQTRHWRNLLVKRN